MTRITVLILGIAAISCSIDRDKLQENGYQILDKHAIAVKFPCRLEADRTLANDSTIGDYMVMVCPQIFCDTTRTTFHLDRLLESGSFVYHLNILTDSAVKSDEFLLRQQIEILSLFNINDYEEIEVDGRKSLVYEIEAKRVTETFIPNSPFTYRIAISGDSSRREKMNEILRTVRIGEF